MILMQTRIWEGSKQNMHLRPQDLIPGGWKEKQTVNKQFLTIEHWVARSKSFCEAVFVDMQREDGSCIILDERS